MEELVDILVTTYNTNEKYLRKQIESILRQTYKNIKIYISDDNSTNKNISPILQEYAEKDKRIKLYMQPKNLGYNKNFEFLLKESKANYIMFSDHDDVWHKDKVEKSLNALKQKDVEFRGYSMECRINAENPSKNFMPCPGTITGLNLPGGNGVRIDTAIYEGYTIPPNYDSMIAKIITHGDSRNEAISKMKRALEETVIEGVDTNIDFLFKIIKNPNFIRGNFDTSFIEKEILKK